jgi:endonuclease G
MTAQNLVADPVFKRRPFRSSRVLTFGAPVTKGLGEPATAYVHVEADLDPVSSLTPVHIGKETLIRVPGVGPHDLPANHFIYPKSTELNSYDALGDEYGSKCLQLDRKDFKAYEAPWFTFGGGDSSGPDNLALGNPINATDDPLDKNNYLRVKTQYALSYNDGRGGPNWVSWHLRLEDIGYAERGGFFPELSLPQGFTLVVPDDYEYSGYDRGHMCPAKDRSASAEDSHETFSMANVLPQHSNINRGVWRTFEEYCRTLARRGNNLYIVSGGYGTWGVIQGSSQVTVPRRLWKVVVVVPRGSDVSRIDRKTRVIALDYPNVGAVRRVGWRAYITTVDDLERKTGFNFLSRIPADIQDALESKRDSGH